MRKTLLIIFTLLATPFAAWADVVQLPETAAAAPSAVPQKGHSMAAVSKQFGAPSTKHPAAGGDTRKHPPITRWDYPGYSVFFERGHVIDVVVPGQPAALHNVEELQKN